LLAIVLKHLVELLPVVVMMAQEFGTPREHRAFRFGFDPGQIAPDNINPTLRAVARDRAIAEVQPRAYYNFLTESV
jgi:hypothetical protein